jgi:hypothetical protein
MMFKHGKGTVVLTQTQHPASGMAKHASGLEHQLLHDRFDAGGAAKNLARFHPA